MAIGVQTDEQVPEQKPKKSVYEKIDNQTRCQLIQMVKDHHQSATVRQALAGAKLFFASSDQSLPLRALTLKELV